MTNKELGQAIRKALKERGWNSRAVSVRVSDAGYSTSVSVKIKDMTINKREVEKIVNAHESIRYDEYSGEILEGANTYVFVEYDWEAMRDASRAYMEQAQEIIDNNKEADTATEVLERDGVKMYYHFNGIAGHVDNHVSLHGEKFADDWYNQKYAAYSANSLAEALMLFDLQGRLA